MRIFFYLLDIHVELNGLARRDGIQVVQNKRVPLAEKRRYCTGSKRKRSGGSGVWSVRSGIFLYNRVARSHVNCFGSALIFAEIAH